MRVPSLTGTRFGQAVLSCLGAAIWLCSMLPFPAVAQQKAEESGRSADIDARKKPATILATPPFFQAIGQTVGCAALNIGSTPQNVTFTFRTQNEFPPQIETITVQPNSSAAIGQGIGLPALPVRVFCEFQASDVTLLRAQGTVFGNGVLQIIPAN
jgi:hypothetical protein